jgi:hypothetical protein
MWQSNIMNNAAQNEPKNLNIGLSEDKTNVRIRMMQDNVPKSNTQSRFFIIVPFVFNQKGIMNKGLLQRSDEGFQVSPDQYSISPFFDICSGLYVARLTEPAREYGAGLFECLLLEAAGIQVAAVP